GVGRHDERSLEDAPGVNTSRWLDTLEERDVVNALTLLTLAVLEGLRRAPTPAAGGARRPSRRRSPQLLDGSPSVRPCPARCPRRPAPRRRRSRTLRRAPGAPRGRRRRWRSARRRAAASASPGGRPGRPRRPAAASW